MAAALAYRSKNSDSSESDSENSDQECLNWKRVTKNEGEDIEKIPLVPPPVEPAPAETINSSLKRKRNTIWCEVLEDQMMSETLKDVGIKNKPKGYGSRGEESYDFTLGKNYCDNDDGSDEPMSDESRKTSFRQHKRFRSDKYVEIDAEGKEAAKKIIRVLAEPKTYLIYRIVKFLGVEKALKFLKMTEDIEENGGLMIKNQARRRTPGGVYLYLLRSDKDIAKDVMDSIFEGEMNSFEKKKKFDELRKRKSKNRKKKKSKGQKEVQTTSKTNSNDSDGEEMEEDISNATVDVVPDSNVIVDVPDSTVNDRSSDLEEGEVE